MSKRRDYISWDSYFMSVAFLSSLRGKDPNTRNGACIVNDKNKIIGTGYNGFPKGCDDDVFPWIRKGPAVDTKYAYSVHAELNAILNSNSSTEGCRMFLYSEKGFYPCSECAKAIVQSGISKVIMAFAMLSDTDVYTWEPTKRMFQAGSVDVELMHFDDFCRGMHMISETAKNVVEDAKDEIEKGTIKVNNKI